MHIYLKKDTNYVDKELELLINGYKPNQTTIESLQSVMKLFLVGISGAGKDTITKRLLSTGKYHSIISHTTRAPRKNHGILEKSGVEYHFISMEDAIEMLQKQEFVEAKWVHQQNIYGTSSKEFVSAANNGKIAIGDIEVQGVAEYMDMAPDTTKPVFLLPPNFESWRQRFNARYEGIVGDGEFYRRMQTAIDEIEHVLQHGYFSIVINDDIKDAVEQVELIISGQPQSEMTWQRGVSIAQRLLEDMRASL